MKDSITILTKMILSKKCYSHVVACFILCSLILYLALFVFTETFANYPLYTQVLLTTALSIIYVTISIPLSSFVVADSGIFYLPFFLLVCSTGFYLIIFKINWDMSNHFSQFCFTIMLAYPLHFLAIGLKKLTEKTISTLKRRIRILRKR